MTERFEPPLTVAEPLLLQLPRKLARGAVVGLRTASVTAFIALLAGLTLTFGLGLVSAPTSIALWLAAVLVGFGFGAYMHRHELPPAAAATVGADGVTARNEYFTRYYSWHDVVDVRQHETELVLMVTGGYAFRVPFRDRALVQAARLRIDRERAAHLQRTLSDRTAGAQRDQRDAVDAGDETRFIERQRRRLGTDYRRGHESIEDLSAELLDADFQLQQRLGAAIALSESRDPSARAALALARDYTSCHILHQALSALLAGTASDAMLVGWIQQMHPAPRRFAPIGAMPAQRIEPAMRIETEEPVDDEAEIEAALAEEEEDRTAQR